MQKVLEASVQYIAKDLRPYKAIEDDGIQVLANSLIEIGARFGKVKAKDVLHQETL